MPCSPDPAPSTPPGWRRPCLHSGRVSASTWGEEGGKGRFVFLQEEFAVGLQVHFPLCACVCAGIRQPWGGKELGLNSNTPCFAFADTGLCAFPGEKGGGGVVGWMLVRMEGVGVWAALHPGWSAAAAEDGVTLRLCDCQSASNSQWLFSGAIMVLHGAQAWRWGTLGDVFAACKFRAAQFPATAVGQRSVPPNAAPCSMGDAEELSCGCGGEFCFSP